MEIGIIALLVINIIGILYLIFGNKKNDNSDQILSERNYELMNKLTKENGELKEFFSRTLGINNKEYIKDLNQFKDLLNKQIKVDFQGLNTNIETQMEKINNKVEMKLNEGFEKTNKTFTNVLERLTKIDEAQRKIEELSTNIVSLQSILSDKKTRGTFGEIQLTSILSSIFGDNNKNIYETQKTLSNGTIVDAILHIPDPMGNITIDSKFPLENYKRMTTIELTTQEKNEHTKLFKKDVKKHIDDIARKYIIPNETAIQAIMFVPAEAIFAEINAYHEDIVMYSQKKNVWIASPTTLMSLLTTVQVILRNLERDKHAKVIQQELHKLGEDFRRYKERWDKLSRNIKTVNKAVDEIHITSEKIGKRFDAISKVEIDIETEEIDLEPTAIEMIG